jgi:hypothetical protein
MIAPTGRARKLSGLWGVKPRRTTARRGVQRGLQLAASMREDHPQHGNDQSGQPSQGEIVEPANALCAIRSAAAIRRVDPIL